MSKSLDPDYTGDKSKSVDAPKTDKEQPKYPSEVIDLPSKGLVYPSNNPLSSGTIELKYMTAKEEDILTSQNLIQKGVVIDKLLESLIIDDINYDDLILGDKNALMISARILGYGKDYTVPIKCPICGNEENYTIDLTKLTDLEIDKDNYNRENEYSFELPYSKRVITFKLLTHGDDKKIADELKYLKDFNKKAGKKNAIASDFTTRLKYMITGVDGDRETKTIREFIDKGELLSRDSLEFRKHLKSFTPDIDTTFTYECPECGGETAMALPMTVEFFWPSTDL